MSVKTIDYGTPKTAIYGFVKLYEARYHDERDTAAKGLIKAEIFYSKQKDGSILKMVSCEYRANRQNGRKFEISRDLNHKKVWYYKPASSNEHRPLRFFGTLAELAALLDDDTRSDRSGYRIR